MTFEYFVAATPRSGSELLCEGLASTGVAGRPYEWFSRALAHYHLGEWQMRAASSQPMNPVAAVGADYIGRVRDACVSGGVRSFKVHWNQVEWYAASNLGGCPWDVMTGPLARIPVISLRRKNVVAQAVSSLIANQTHVFHKDREGTELSFELKDEPPGSPQYEFTQLMQLVIEILRYEISWDEFLGQQPCRKLNLYYEELSLDFERCCLRALKFLGLPAVPPEPPRLIRLSSEINAIWERRLVSDIHRTGVIKRMSPHVIQRILQGCGFQDV